MSLPNDSLSSQLLPSHHHAFAFTHDPLSRSPSQHHIYALAASLRHPITIIITLPSRCPSAPTPLHQRQRQTQLDLFLGAALPFSFCFCFTCSRISFITAAKVRTHPSFMLFTVRSSGRSSKRSGRTSPSILVFDMFSHHWLIRSIRRRCSGDSGRRDKNPPPSSTDFPRRIHDLRGIDEFGRGAAV